MCSFVSVDIFSLNSFSDRSVSNTSIFHLHLFHPLYLCYYEFCKQQIYDLFFYFTLSSLSTFKLSISDLATF